MSSESLPESTPIYRALPDRSTLGGEIIELLSWLVEIPSPSGMTRELVDILAETLIGWGLDARIDAKGGLSVSLPGGALPGRAVAAHADTIGCMVTAIKPSGRLSITQVGTWSARFAEGSRVEVHADGRLVLGTILPLKAAGHLYNEAVDTQGVGWDCVEVRLDATTNSANDTHDLGISVGDFVTPVTRVEEVDGWINSRHLDNKGGLAAVLLVLRELAEDLRDGVLLPAPFHVLMSVFEEVGHGLAPGVPAGVEELVAVDIAPVGPEHPSTERDLTVVAQDASGPYDRALGDRLIDLARTAGIGIHRDVYEFYRSDASAAAAGGAMVASASLGFGTDATHGYERTHVDSLTGLVHVLLGYARQEPPGSS